MTASEHMEASAQELLSAKHSGTVALGGSAPMQLSAFCTMADSEQEPAVQHALLHTLHLGDGVSISLAAKHQPEPVLDDMSAWQQHTACLPILAAGEAGMLTLLNLLAGPRSYSYVAQTTHLNHVSRDPPFYDPTRCTARALGQLPDQDEHNLLIPALMRELCKTLRSCSLRTELIENADHPMVIRTEACWIIATDHNFYLDGNAPDITVVPCGCAHTMFRSAVR